MGLGIKVPVLLRIVKLDLWLGLEEKWSRVVVDVLCEVVTVK